MPEPEKKETTPPTPDPTPRKAIEDDILSALADDLTEMIGHSKKNEPKEEPKTPDIKPAPETPPADAAPAPEKPATPAQPIKAGVKQKEDARAIAEDVVAKRLAEARANNTPTALPKEEAKATPIYDENLLSPEQKEELEDARFFESLDPKNKGRADELLRYYKGVDEWVAAKKKEGTGNTFDANDEEFVTFVNKSRPAWADREKEKIRRERLKAEAKAEAKREVMKDLEPEIKAAKQEAREAKFTPIIERQVNEFVAQMKEETKTEDALEKEIYESFQSVAENLATDFLRLINNVDTVGDHNPEQRRKNHQWLNAFIDQQNKVFEKQGGDKKVRDGKTFVTADEYARMAAANDTKIDTVWTFGVPDYLKMLRTHAVGIAKTQIKHEEELAGKRGFVRQKQSEKAKEEKQPEPSSGIRATSTPAPGAVQPDAKEDGNHIGKELIEVLQLR
jgi:hypothetical protein